MAERLGEGRDPLFEVCGVTAQDLPARSLYVVALPIGNAADITLRALWVLGAVDAVYAEDTRVTRPLLDRYGIDTPLTAAHQHNERAAAQEIVERLQRGERIALVTDAGTPGVSDPGARIARIVSDAGLRVVPVPGASSVAAAVSIAGLTGSSFRFLGFLPTGSREREAALRSAAADGEALVLLEAPHRIGALAAMVARVLAPERRVVLARELTKKFEAIVSCTAAELTTLSIDERGEYVVLIDRATEPTARDIDADTRRWLQALLAELPPARAAAVAAHVSGHPKEALYALALQLKAGPTR
jgi:16S rRNA (cytidine1402-2'-O)-methyltransferase